ncbi:MAG: hypothetical protein OEY28_13460 [Nitrospira sp.]|nr:hypothetical protein [Nitrospira sp.]
MPDSVSGKKVLLIGALIVLVVSSFALAAVLLSDPGRQTRTKAVSDGADRPAEPDPSPGPGSDDEPQQPGPASQSRHTPGPEAGSKPGNNSPGQIEPLPSQIPPPILRPRPPTEGEGVPGETPPPGAILPPDLSAQIEQAHRAAGNIAGVFGRALR